MRNFILRRLLQTLPMLLLASFIIFLLFAKTPGDFIDGNITLTAARAAELKAIYGLDQPLLTRYLHWLGQLLRGDLGFSLQYQIEGEKFSFLALGSQQWVFKSDNVSFEYKIENGYKNIIKDTIVTIDRNGNVVSRGNRAAKTQLRSAPARLPGSRREQKD